MTKTWDDVRKKYIKKFTCAGGTKDCRLSHDRCFSDNANYETVDKYFTTAFYQIMEELRGEIGDELADEKLYSRPGLMGHDNTNGIIRNKLRKQLREKVLSLLPKDTLNTR